MKNFQYYQPKTLKDASEYINAHKDKSILFAGGTDVLGLMKDYIIAPDSLVNLKSIKELNQIKYLPGKGIQIGALVTLEEILNHPVIKEKYSVLAQAANEVASPQFRNIGTLGGNLCQRPRCFYFRGDFNCLRKGGDLCYAVDGNNKYHCVIGGSPCYIVHPSDTAVALLALDAKVSIISKAKSRLVPISEFFILPEDDFTKENILTSDEIIDKIVIPEPLEGTISSYTKFKERKVWDFAIVSVAAVIQKNGSNFVGGKLAFGGIAPKPWTDDRLNRSLKGLSFNEDKIKEFTSKFLSDADVLEMNSYKIPLTRNLLKRSLLNLV